MEAREVRVRLEDGAQRPAGVPWYAFAWTTFDAEGAPTVHLANSFWLDLLVGYAGRIYRVQHELEHALDRAFVNTTHHPWWHVCVRSFFPFRLGHHAQVSDLHQARKLLREGWVDA